MYPGDKIDNAFISDRSDMFVKFSSSWNLLDISDLYFDFGNFRFFILFFSLVLLLLLLFTLFWYFIFLFNFLLLPFSNPETILLLSKKIFFASIDSLFLFFFSVKSLLFILLFL